jgi:CcmD family protein
VTWTNRITVAFSLALALTLVPLVLKVPLKFDVLFHWPMLVFERGFRYWIPLNAGRRVITLFLANVAIWTGILLPVLTLFRALKHKRTA